MQGRNSPVVRVQLVFGIQESKREVVKHATAAHEVVEIDGFVFRRKRKAPEPPACQPPDADVDGHAAADAEVASSPSAVKVGLMLTPNRPDSGEGMAGADTSPAGAGDQRDAGAAAAVPFGSQAARMSINRSSRVSATSDELTYLVQWLLMTELKKCDGMDAGQVSAAASAITDRFAVALQQHLEQRTPPAAGASSAEQAAGGSAPLLSEQQVAMAAAASSLPSLVALPYQVERLKRALQQKRDKLLQEEAEWAQLEDRYLKLQQQEPVSQQPGTAEERPPAAAAATAEATAGADAMDVDGGTVGANAEPGLPASPAAGAARLAAGSAAAAKAAALLSAELRVEGLAALVTKVEQLAAEAEAAASQLQASFHQDTFRVFPHVNSPAFLIRSIVRPTAAAD